MSRGGAVTIASLGARKAAGEKTVAVVAWDYQMARIADRAGVDMIVVGDSVGINLWGHASPLEVTLDEMLVVAKAVRRGTARALVCCDIPFGPVQEGTAVPAAVRLVKEAGADLVKLDAASDYLEAVSSVDRAGIPVFAQFGLTPQRMLRYGIDYAAMSSPDAQVPEEMTASLVEEAKQLEKAGAAMLDFTNSGPVVGAEVTRAVSIPVLGGFGGGPWLDGRVRMINAAIGYAESGIDDPPDTYADVARIAFDALTAFAADARAARQIKGGLRVPGSSTVPFVDADGIRTRYETYGSGPALLMFSPGGFDAKLENWSSFSLYARLGLLPVLAERYTCIAYDRRESGRSGGRVERIGVADYVAQAAGLLDALGIERAHLMGGCVGCSSVAAFAVAHPQRSRSMVLYSPAGGPRYRIKQRDRFAQHAAFVAEHGVAAVVDRALAGDAGFTTDPAVGPWVSVLRHDPTFAAEYASLPAVEYLSTLHSIVAVLFDRDTVPGAEPEQLMGLRLPALIVPGQDDSHAPSAARYLQECLSDADYWDVPVGEQTEHTAPARVRHFLDALS